jgi:hypothetical protein
MTKMTRVWIPNQSSKGALYEGVDAYGELSALTVGYQSLGNLERLSYTFNRAIHKTDAEDYLLMSGIVIFAVLAALGWLTKHGKVKLLMYDRKIDGFRPLILTHQNLTRTFDRFTINEANDKDA